MDRIGDPRPGDNQPDSPASDTAASDGLPADTAGGAIFKTGLQVLQFTGHGRRYQYVAGLHVRPLLHSRQVRF